MAFLDYICFNVFSPSIPVNASKRCTSCYLISEADYHCFGAYPFPFNFGGCPQSFCLIPGARTSPAADALWAPV